MPAYTVEFQTEGGPRREPFTIDPERELGPQVRQVLEELRQHGVVIAGRPGDVATVWWHGRELDAALTPEALGISPARALEIRMRAPAAEPAPPPPAPAARQRVRLFTRGAYAAPLTGAAGALVAWSLAATVRDLGGIVDGYARLDLLATALLGATVGAFVAGGAALRRSERVLPAAAIGLLLGLAGGLAGGALGTAAAGAAGAESAFALRRVVAWTALGAAAGLAVALRWARRDPRRVAEGAGCGALGGALAGAAFSFSGPGDFWQALAFVLLGAGVGAGACSLAVRRADGVVELETVDGRAVGLLRHREWEVREGALLRVGARRGPAAAVALEDGRAWAAPAAEGDALAVAGRWVASATELADGERLEVGGARFRFRRFAGAA